MIGPNGAHYDKVLIPSSKTISPYNDHSSSYVEDSDCDSDVSVSSEQLDSQHHSSLSEEDSTAESCLDDLKTLFRTPTKSDFPISKVSNKFQPSCSDIKLEKFSSLIKPCGLTFREVPIFVSK